MSPQGNRNHYGVDILAFQERAIVRVPLSVGVVILPGDRQAFFQVGRIDIAYSHELKKIGIAVLHQNPALAARANDSSSHRLDGTRLPKQRSGSRNRRDRFDKVAAAELFLLFGHGNLSIISSCGSRSTAAT